MVCLNVGSLHTHTHTHNSFLRGKLTVKCP